MGEAVGIAGVQPGPVLAIEGLRVTYAVPGGGLFGKRVLRAVEDVSLHIGPGECLGLVGESGCGKSTIAKAILGLTPIAGGRVALGGQDVVALRHDRRKQAKLAQMVFQDPFSSLNPRDTIRQILAGPLALHGIGDAEEREGRVIDMLRKVGLSPEAADRRPHEFSGGQRQRICIARALIVEPKLVICDEPVSALDVSIRAQIINLLLQLKSELGVALLLISHDLGVVEHMSDRIAVMYLGRIIEEGGWREIFAAPSHPYTQALIAAIPDPLRVDEAARRMTGEPPSALTPPAGCAFHPRCPVAFAPCGAGPVPELTRAGADHRARCHLLAEESRA